MANKVTKRDIINQMLENEAIAANQVFVDFLNHEIELLDRKAANRKPTKTQQENEVLKQVVLTVLDDEGATVTEIQTKDEQLKGLPNQKVTAILRALVNDGQVVRFTEGKRTLFKVA